MVEIFYVKGVIPMVKILYYIIKKVNSIIYRIKLKYFLAEIKTKDNITCPSSVKFNKIPLIDIREGSSLEVGENVTLNSNNYDYHISMYSPIKLFADREGAIIKIGDNSRIHGTCIHAYKSITIGRSCLIAANTNIIDCNGHDLSFDDPSNRINTQGTAKPVTIKDNVWIGVNCTILAGVTIGEGSVISANSVVIKDIPSMVIAGGSPAKIIKQF